MLTRQNFYIGLILLCTAVIIIATVQPSEKPIPPEQWRTEAVFQSKRIDGQMLDVKIQSIGCLTMMDYIKIGAAVTKVIGEVSMDIPLTQVPAMVGQNIDPHVGPLIKELWIRTAAVDSEVDSK